MKKLFTSLLLILSLLLGSCEFFADKPEDSDNSTDIEDQLPDTSCPGDSDGDSDGAGGDKTDTEENQHKDSDDNGICDLCSESVITEINFFVINDFHGKMSDSDTQPGADELSLYLKTLKSTHSNAVLLSSGDMWQGGPESNLSRGLLVTEWMNELDFDSMTLGNHEYDWGEKYIEENAELAEFPLLAINVYDRVTNKRAEYCEPSVMIERGGIQIGIIGAIGDCYSSISADKREDVYFKTDYALTALVKEESERLRALGADYIVYSIHDGYGNSSSGTSISNGSLADYYDTSLSSGGYVDVVFEGHTHQNYSLVDNWGVYHIQGGGDNSGFVHYSVEVNFVTGSDKTKSASVIPSSFYEHLEDDPYIDELYEKYAEAISKMYEVLGQNPSFISGYTLRQKVADLYYELGVARWGDKYDIALGGGYISVRSPYNLYAGEVTYGDLMMLFPFDNELVLCSVSGKNLRTKFFYTSNSNYYVSYGAYGADIKNSIDDNATYYVIVDTYSAYYAPNGLTIIEKYDDMTYARDMLAQYIKEGKLW